MDKKGEREGKSRFPFKKLLSHGDGKFVREPFIASLIWGIKTY